jgi:hypothetical protein
MLFSNLKAKLKTRASKLTTGIGDLLESMDQYKRQGDIRSRLTIGNTSILDWKSQRGLFIPGIEEDC